MPDPFAAIAQPMPMSDPFAALALPIPDELHPNAPQHPALSSTVLNPRIRNVQMPYDPSQGVGRNFYEGGKEGVELDSIMALPYSTLPGLLKAAAGGALGGAAGKQVAKSAGGDEFAQEVGGDVGGLVGAGAATAGTNWATAKVKAFYSALPEDIQKELTGLLSPRLAHALRLADALGIGEEAPVTSTPKPVPAAALEASAAATAKPGAPIWRDATRQNVPYAGEDYGATKAIIDKAVPPSGETASLNQRVQAHIDEHLSQGDIQSAEKILDATAKAADPTWYPPTRPRVVPSVQNIRERIAQVNAAEAQPNRVNPSDMMDDKALQQEMNWDLERHQWAVEAEARREFIARNSTGVTKAELTGAAEKPVVYTKTPGVPSPGTGAGMTPKEVDDLMGKMQQMLESAKKAKAQGND